MRLPTLKNSFMRFVKVGRYVLAKLQSAGHRLLAEGVAVATDRVLEAGLGIDGAAVQKQTAIAHRDWAEDLLHNAARDLRLALISRGRNAVSQPPYTRIFPDGIGFYTYAKLDEVVRRYQGLISLVNTQLANDDTARLAAVDSITSGLEKFSEAVNEVNTAKNAEEEARNRCSEVCVAWQSEMLKVYGTLLSEYGKKGAERFFPKWQKSRKKADREKAANSGDNPGSDSNGQKQDSNTPQNSQRQADNAA